MLARYAAIDKNVLTYSVKNELNPTWEVYSMENGGFENVLIRKSCFSNGSLVKISFVPRHDIKKMITGFLK